MVLLSPLSAGALLTKTCLTGTDPAVAADAAQIGAVRSLIDDVCICARFDGTKGKTHSNYVSCAADIADHRRDYGGRLPKPRVQRDG